MVLNAISMIEIGFQYSRMEASGGEVDIDHDQS